MFSHIVVSFYQLVKNQNRFTVKMAAYHVNSLRFVGTCSPKKLVQKQLPVGFKSCFLFKITTLTRQSLLSTDTTSFSANCAKNRR